MFSKELRDLLFQVITSWQVIAVTVAVIFYFFLISYATRSYRRPRHTAARVAPKTTPAVSEEEVSITEAEEMGSDDDELGLEEE